MEDKNYQLIESEIYEDLRDIEEETENIDTLSDWLESL